MGGPELNCRSWSTNIWLLRIVCIMVTLASFLHCLSIGHPNILETDEYLEKSFNTNLAALLWIILVLCSVDEVKCIQEQISPLTCNIKHVLLTAFTVTCYYQFSSRDNGCTKGWACECAPQNNNVQNNNMFKIQHRQVLSWGIQV